ncbi:hypothetical protein QGM71_05630 [Virgibacillus sp. C22-A2]|uniref:Uncharacterized protein n=1 Tax=Virgibacillus tibetensis TaxID=3042313 RepID=A0ABU6KCY1_9BACI|nr:hypothetical protein [Virgibacillus sp. C22-A2]
MDNEEQSKKPSEMSQDELPDVKAFEDEFTRRFLQSTEETRPGYYPFLSGTGKYKMDFPLDATIDEHGYALKDKEYEGLFIGVDAGEIKSSIRINFSSLHEKGREHTILDMINHQFNDELLFDEFTSGDSTLYLSYFEDDETYYGYAGFLQNEVENGGIRVLYESECIVGKEECEGLVAESKDVMKELIESIQFTVQSNESE